MKEKTKVTLQLLSLFVPYIILCRTIIGLINEDFFHNDTLLLIICILLAEVLIFLSVYFCQLALYPKEKEKKFITSSKGKIEIED